MSLNMDQRKQMLRMLSVTETLRAAIRDDLGLNGGPQRVSVPTEEEPGEIPDARDWPNGAADEPAKTGAGLGLGPDAPTVTNERGGRQSHVPYRLDLLPALATLAIGRVLDHGARRYGENNWHRISVKEHLNHAAAHLFAFLSGDEADDHLAHFATRALMALEIREMAKRHADETGWMDDAA